MNYFTPRVILPQLSTSDREIFHMVDWMITHSLTDHNRADLQALISSLAYDDTGAIRGDLLTVLFWRFPQYIDFRPVADVLGVLPSSLRQAVGQ